MNIILGFGSTEEDFEQQEFNFVEEFVKQKAKDSKGKEIYLNFGDEFAAELNEKLKERRDYYHKLRDEYKEASNFPDRYSSYYFDVLHNFSNLCVVFKFSHINRRHALSPDGWALMGTKKVYYADSYDFEV